MLTVIRQCRVAINFQFVKKSSICEAPKPSEIKQGMLVYINIHRQTPQQSGRHYYTE